MKIITTFFALILLATSAIAQVSPTEKQALLDLHTATDGANWNNTWNIETPVKDWHGVTVTNNQVTALNLMFNNLKGEIPASINDLKHIKSIELSFNQINGVLPATLGELKDLKTLAINSNQIQGSIPTGIGELDNLKQLHLSSNQLSGSIPSTLGELSNLEVLNVFDNNLTGTIPYALSKSNRLEKLIIAENDIIVNENLADIVLFEVDNENTMFKTPSSFINKTVIAIETSDDDN